MRAGIYTPYWETQGGGEKYTAGVILALIKLGYEVDVFWSESKLLSNLERRFGMDLSKARINEQGYAKLTQGSFLNKLVMQKQYDLLFWVSDGSVPFMCSSNNILHFQVPFHDVGGKSLINRLKLFLVNHLVCNSRYTKGVIDQEFGCRSLVLYPPVKAIELTTSKENLILSVGRFDSLLHSKRQDVLIDAFKQLNQPDWKLVLAGGVLRDTEMVDQLRSQAKSYPIEILTNPDWETIRLLYNRAKIYWHAAGFGLDLTKQPEKAEHFGMATVEAMSAGAVPIVFGGGGQLEVVEDGKQGFIFQTKDDLINQTLRLMRDDGLRSELAQAAILKAKNYSQEVFESHFRQIIS